MSDRHTPFLIRRNKVSPESKDSGYDLPLITSPTAGKRELQRSQIASPLSPQLRRDSKRVRAIRMMWNELTRADSSDEDSKMPHNIIQSIKQAKRKSRARMFSLEVPTRASLEKFNQTLKLGLRKPKPMNKPRLTSPMQIRLSAKIASCPFRQTNVCKNLAQMPMVNFRKVQNLSKRLQEEF